MQRFRLIAVVVVLTVLTLAGQFAGAAHPRALHGTGGAVASAAPAATQAGLEVLRNGGNAADAAVATALALAVVHPAAGNLGGGGFAVVRIAGGVMALDFRETAPATATREMYLGRDGEPVPDRTLVGPLAAGVPGSPAGLFELHRRYGRLEWRRVVDPALRLAEQGFVVTDRLAREIARSAGLLERFPETAAVWLPDGSPPAPGRVMRLPQLAATLRGYASEGPSSISEGPAAAAIETVTARYGGVLRAEDLGAYQPVWRDPVRFRAYGWQVASMPLPSSGGIIVAQTCGLLERLGWAELPRFGSQRAHLLVEVWRRSFADRFLMGDPRTSRADEVQLLAPEWLDRRAAEIKTHRATPSRLVRPWSEEEVLEPAATTHLSVIDGDGNAVSLTTTLNGRFGCGLLVPGVGFLLNNEMDDFLVAPGRANQFGLVQGEANAVGPGKRMLSSMTPTLAWRSGEVLVLGAPGGSRIPTATVQVFLNVTVDGDGLQAAVNRPRLHHQWLPDSIFAEPDALAPDTRRSLERRGHLVQERARMGLVNAVRRSADGTVAAAADPRGPGTAAVESPAPGTQ
jgi:gamma-glutamyltranspeptidase/glutathione hydrolase